MPVCEVQRYSFSVRWSDHEDDDPNGALLSDNAAALKYADRLIREDWMITSDISFDRFFVFYIHSHNPIALSHCCPPFCCSGTLGPTDGRHCNSSNNAFASFRSRVSKPSVNHP